MNNSQKETSFGYSYSVKTKLGYICRVPVFTTTLKLQVAVRPAPSVAVAVTTLVPTGNVPDSSEFPRSVKVIAVPVGDTAVCVTVTAPQLSAPVAWLNVNVVLGVPQFTVCGLTEGHCIVGG